MCNTCHDFDEWETCKPHFKFQLLSLISFNSHPLSLSFSSCIEASSLSFLSKTLSWWWSFSFHGLFSSGWCLLSPLLLYLPLQFHGWKYLLKDLIEVQRSILHRSFSSKLPSSGTRAQELHVGAPETSINFKLYLLPIVISSFSSMYLLTCLVLNVVNMIFKNFHRLNLL